MTEKNTLQIVELLPAIVKDQKELNAYVEKAEKLGGQLKEIGIVEKENYDDVKKLRAEITAGKTSIEDTRMLLKRPLLNLGKEIDARAKELAKPYIEMKDKIQEKIGEYEKEENTRKEQEKERVLEIAKKISEFKDLKKLEIFYKSLSRNDQTKKVIAQAGMDRKREIPIEIRKEEIKVFKEKFEKVIDIQILENELVEYKKLVENEEEVVFLTNKINALKVEKLEEENKKAKADKIKKENATKDFIVLLHPIKLEELKNGDYPKLPAEKTVDTEEIKTWIENRIILLENLELKAEADKQRKTTASRIAQSNKQAEEQAKKDKIAQDKKDEEARKVLEDADNTLLEVLEEKVVNTTDIKILKDFGSEVLKLKTEKNQRSLSLSVQEKIKELEEIEKNKNIKKVQNFYKKCGLTKDNQEMYHIEETEKEVKIFKLVDTLVLKKGKSIEGMR